MIAALSLAIDNGPTEAQWRGYMANADDYLPAIEKFVGMCLFLGVLHDDRDFPNIEAAATHCEALAVLSEDERYFVFVAAVNILCHHDASETIRDMARAWIADGAPE